MKKFFKLFLCLFAGVLLTACLGHTHNMGEWKTKTAATCISAEIKHRVCSCGHEETKEGSPKLNHNYKIVETIEPTQSQTGYIKYSCDCGENYKQYRCLLTFSSVVFGQNFRAMEV